MAIDSLTLSQYEQKVQEFIKETSQSVLFDNVLLRLRSIEFYEGAGTGYLHGMIKVQRKEYHIRINEKELLLDRDLKKPVIRFTGRKVRDLYHKLELKVRNPCSSQRDHLCFQPDV